MSFLRIFLVVIICLFSLSACSKDDLSKEVLLSGGDAFDVSLPKTDGSYSSVVSAQKGNNVILMFWATWCPHCREELAVISDQLKEIEGHGIKVVLVNAGETLEEVRAYLSWQQIGLASFLDEENVLQEPYQVDGIPTLVFINKQGKIVDVTHSLPSDYLTIF